jgi:hypothetical protein
VDDIQAEERATGAELELPARSRALRVASSGFHCPGLVHRPTSLSGYNLKIALSLAQLRLVLGPQITACALIVDIYTASPHQNTRSKLSSMWVQLHVHRQ